MNREWEEATKAADIVRVNNLLDAGAEIDALDRHNQTALMLAAHRGDIALTRLLVERGANLNHAAKYGFTALMLAVIANHPMVVAFLLSAGADATQRATKSASVSAGLTAEDLASGPNREAILAVFKQHHATS